MTAVELHSPLNGAILASDVRAFQGLVQFGRGVRLVAEKRGRRLAGIRGSQLIDGPHPELVGFARLQPGHPILAMTAIPDRNVKCRCPHAFVVTLFLYDVADLL